MVVVVYSGCGALRMADRLVSQKGGHASQWGVISVLAVLGSTHTAEQLCAVLILTDLKLFA